MAKKSQKKARDSKESTLTARLELIRKRHRELILGPREMIAADLEEGSDDVFEDAGLEHAELAEAIGVGRF